MQKFKLHSSAVLAVILLLCTVFMSSCNISSDKSLENVKKLFPNSKVYKMPENTFIFYVVDSTGVKKVSCLNWTNNNVSDISIAEIK